MITKSFYSVGNRDGRNYAPMKTQESFHSRAAFLSYKTGYNEALDGIYETDNPQFDAEINDLKAKSDMPSLVTALNDLTDEQKDLLEMGFGDGKYAQETCKAYEYFSECNLVSISCFSLYNLNRTIR